MAGMMRGNRVGAESSGRVQLDTILKTGVAASPDVDALAVRGEREVSVLVWNYQDDDVPAPAAKVQLEIVGLRAAGPRLLVRHYRIDQTHSNAWTSWKRMGAPQTPSPEQYKELEAAGALQLFESPHWVDAKSGSVKLAFDLPRQGVSLVQASW